MKLSFDLGFPGKGPMLRHMSSCDVTELFVFNEYVLLTENRVDANAQIDKLKEGPSRSGPRNDGDNHLNEPLPANLFG